MERVTWRDGSKHAEQFNFSDGNCLWCWLGFCVVSALRDVTVTSLQHHTLQHTVPCVCLIPKQLQSVVVTEIGASQGSSLK